VSTVKEVVFTFANIIFISMNTVFAPYDPSLGTTIVVLTLVSKGLSHKPMHVI
jgi:hypothetical protein